MAVIVRSVSIAAALPRMLTSAGVPVAQPAVQGPIGDHPAVRALLLVLAVTVDGLDADGALALLTGPIGRVDPVSLRQLRRVLLRLSRNDGTADIAPDNGALLVDALIGAKPDLPTGLAKPVNRVRAVLAAAARSNRDHGDPRHTLWQAWERSGLQRRWLSSADRGGADGTHAERNLAAVTALFDLADAYVTRTTGASLSGLIDHIEAMRLAPVLVDDNASTESVAIVSPHAALGREWDVVVIAGLQDGLWPNTTPRGGVLGTQRLLDFLDGVGDDASARAPLLAEERRLLIAAMGRARRRLLVTAVDSEAGDDCLLASPFVEEIARWSTSNIRGRDEESTKSLAAPPVLSASGMVGRLRAVVCAPHGAVEDSQRCLAATQLARMAEAKIPGADPNQWAGLKPLSSERPLWDDSDHTVRMSPSTLQTLSDCPLRWMAERHGGADRRELGSVLGSLFHAVISDPGKSAAQMIAELESVWGKLPFDSPWYASNELDRYRAMVTAFVAWRSATRHELTEIGTEIDLEGEIAQPGELPRVQMRGRVDRLERDAEGRLVIVDIKTGKSPATKDEAANHAQLALYQLAVAAGASDHGDEPGGGRLVYPGKQTSSGAAERAQPALTPESSAQWREVVQRAAAATAGPDFEARINAGCAHCPMRPSCPAHSTQRDA
jgi:RecB family exonuclease